MGNEDSNGQKDIVTHDYAIPSNIAGSVQLKDGSDFERWITDLVEKGVVKEGDRVKVPGTHFSFTYGGSVDFSKKGHLTYEERALIDRL